ncbi:MAG: hypothetical protein COZ15_06795 [Elusimicrobia bacterium CG_4_10_14_3_um_filter_49_12_50_7]|nr:MAG: hypothetical protein COS41_04015 [Elusimicrobia bacterium CG03_land_8_20_14_0_80_50_18]PIX15209.1 MAG: hypothetical protein COZ72_04055 [Elusimicrobia bacterium CG_4_8_14_3_um_filter_50_9]PIY15654.1 MAG: hypothetical protein COZ15_06795 [Elusimicrobia bacterium CG_4_10_14_3_um_filter_49_12_50_7]
MSAPRKVCNVQLVEIQSMQRACPERSEGLAASIEPNFAPCLVTNSREAKGKGCWAATQVKGLSPEIYIIPVADTFHVVEGSILTTDKSKLWRT